MIITKDVAASQKSHFVQMLPLDSNRFVKKKKGLLTHLFQLHSFT